MAGVGRFHAWRQAATAAAALALVVLVLVAATREPGPAAAAQAKGKEGKAPAAAKPSIKGLQGEVDKVMVAERRAGQLVRKAMMEKDQDEVQLESAEDGLQASAESPDTSATSLKSSHTSIQQIKDQIAAATKRAEKAKATRAKLQKELDKELNQLAHQQFIAHKAAAAKSGGPAAAMAAAAVSAVGTVTGKGGSSLATAVKEQETVLAGMDQQLLKLPKVRKALQQSLNEKELKIASEVAKSLGAQFNITGIDDALIAEVAVATAEKEKDIPLLDDAATPALNFTAPPLADALLTDFEQAKKEVEIDKTNQPKK